MHMHTQQVLTDCALPLVQHPCQRDHPDRPDRHGRHGRP